jgi:hypothetical protein
MPLSLRDWLPEDHLAWFMLASVEELDLNAFYTSYAFMRRVLQTRLGGDLYRKRKGMIEPVFGNTKFNRGIDRFQRRGRFAVRSEWRLITATHNLLKLHTHQLAIAAP